MSAFENSSGKINSSLFRDIVLPYTGKSRNEVVIGPEFGVDTSVIDLGNGLGLAVSSDPLSLLPSLGLKKSAWLSVHLLVNDMATTGFSPVYGQFVFNLPAELSKSDFEIYWKNIHRFCDEAGVAITGGHTGQIEGQNSTISGGGTMFLTAPLDQIITSRGAEPGDLIIVTKVTALIASSILALSFPETVNSRLGENIYKTACDNFYRTSSLNDALSAVEVLENRRELKAMHDVTEGGVLGAIAELAEASGCGFVIENDSLPTDEASRSVCELFEIDHRFSVGAGSMIMAVKPGVENRLIQHLQNRSISATVVGEFRDKEKGFKILKNRDETSFQFDGNDPYWGAFFKALNKGWN